MSQTMRSTVSFVNTQSEAPTRRPNPYAEPRAAVCNLLVAQYKAAGTTKNPNVLAFISSRIKRLGGEVPAICVATKKLQAVQELVQAAIDVVPHLVAFNIRKSGLDGWFAQSVSSALSDAYKLASDDRILGVELQSLAAADSAEAKARIEQGMIVSVKQLIALLVNVVPLAYRRNSSCGLWLGEKNQFGKPLQNLIKDINRMQELARHLSPTDRIRFDKAIDLARLAHAVRSEYPLNEYDDMPVVDTEHRPKLSDDVSDHNVHVNDVYYALCKMLEFADNEDKIESTYQAFSHGSL